MFSIFTSGTSTKESKKSDLSKIESRLKALYTEASHESPEPSNWKYTAPLFYEARIKYNLSPQTKATDSVTFESIPFKISQETPYIFDLSQSSGQNSAFIGMVNEDQNSNELYFQHLTLKWASRSSEFLLDFVLRADLSFLVKNPSLLRESPDVILAFLIKSHPTYNNQLSLESISKILSQTPPSQCLILMDGFESLYSSMDSVPKVKEVIELAKRYNLIADLTKSPASAHFVDTFSKVIINYGYTKHEIFQAIASNYIGTTHYNHLIEFFNSNDYMIDLARSPIALHFICNTLITRIESLADTNLLQLTQTRTIKEIYDLAITKYSIKTATDKNKILLLTNFLMKTAFNELTQTSAHAETTLRDSFLSVKDLLTYNNIFPLLKISQTDDITPRIIVFDKYREFLAAQYVIEFLRREDTSKLNQIINAALTSKEATQVLRHVVSQIALIKDSASKSLIIKKFLDSIQSVIADQIFNPENEHIFIVKVHVVAELYEIKAQIFSSELESFIKSIDDSIITHFIELKNLIIDTKYKSPLLVRHLMEILIHGDENEILNSIEILTKINIQDNVTKNLLARQLIAYAYSDKPDLVIASINGLKLIKDLEQTQNFFIRSLGISDNLYTTLSFIDLLSQSPSQRNLDILMSNFHTEIPLVYLAILKAIEKLAYLLPNKKTLVDLIIINLIKFENLPGTEISSLSLKLLNEYREVSVTEINNIIAITTIANIKAATLERLLILIKYNFFSKDEISTLVLSLTTKVKPSSPFHFASGPRLVEQHLPIFINTFKILNQAYSLIHENLKKDVVTSLNYIISKYSKLVPEFLLHCEQIIISNPETFLNFLLDKTKTSSSEDFIITHTLKLLTNTYNAYKPSVQIEIIESIERSFLRDYHTNLEPLNDAYCLLLLKALPTLSGKRATDLVSNLLTIKLNILPTPNYLRVIATDISKPSIINYLQETLQSHLGNELKFVVLEEIASSLRTANYSTKSLYLNLLIENTPSFTDIKLKIECIKIIKDLLPSLSTPEMIRTIDFIIDRLQNEINPSVILELAKFINFHAEHVLNLQSGIFELLHSKISRIENEEIVSELFLTLNNIRSRSSLTKDVEVHLKAFSEIINNPNADYLHRKSAINVLKNLIIELYDPSTSIDRKKYIPQAIQIYLDNLSSYKHSILSNYLVKTLNDIYIFLLPNSKKALIDILISKPSDNYHYFNLFIKLISDTSITWKTKKLNQLKEIFLEYNHASLETQNNPQMIKELDELAMVHFNSNSEKLSSSFKDKVESLKELIIHRIIGTENTLIKQVYLKLLISLDLELIRTIEFVLEAQLLLSPSITDLEFRANELIYLLSSYPDNVFATNIVVSLQSTYTTLTEQYLYRKETKDRIRINAEEVGIISEAKDKQILLQQILDLENPSIELVTPTRRYSEPLIPPPPIPLKRSYSDSSPGRRTDLMILPYATLDKASTYSDTFTTSIDPESQITIQPINIQPPNKIDLSSVIASGGLMKFTEVWPSIKFLLTKYAPVLPILDNYNLLPNINPEGQHFILSTLYTIGATSLGITLNTNPYVVGASIALFWLKPYIYSSKEALLEYIDDKFYLDQFSKNTLNFALESTVIIGTSLPFIPLNLFASASVFEKATSLLPFLSQASLSIIINNMNALNTANQPSSYFTLYTPKLATTAALITPLYFNQEILSYSLNNQYSLEIKLIFLISNIIATAQLTYISTEFLSIEIEKAYYNIYHYDEKDTQPAGEILPFEI